MRAGACVGLGGIVLLVLSTLAIDPGDQFKHEDADVGLSEAHGRMAAFGDFNGDKLYCFAFLLC